MSSGGVRDGKNQIFLAIEDVGVAHNAEEFLCFRISVSQAKDLLDTLHELLNPVEGERDGKIRTTDRL